MKINLSTFDIVILLLYFCIVLSFGLYVSRQTKTSDDLFLAGRKLSWAPIGLSLFASNISSTTLIGLMGAAYAGGLYVSNYEWMATIILIIFAFIYVPIFFRSRIKTIPEFLEKRFGSNSRKYTSALTIIMSVAVDTSGSLYAGAIVLKVCFPALALWPTCAGLAIITGLYTAAGGLTAVVYTDVIQSSVLLLGSTLLTYFILSHPGINFHWAAITTQLDPGLFSIVNPAHHPLSDDNLPWLGTLTGVPILGFYYWITNQYIAQRVLGAKSLDDARWGVLFGGLLKLTVLFIMVLPGVLARIIYPNIHNIDTVFPKMITTLLPIGVTGIVMAALIAAIMSSIDSTLNSAATLITLDFITPRMPNISEKNIIQIGRVVMILIMLLAAIWAPQISHFRGLFSYLQQMFAYLVPPVVVLFIFGLLTIKGTDVSAMFTLAGGHFISITFFILQKINILPKIHFTLVSAIIFLISSMLYLATLNLGKQNPESVIKQLTRQPAPPPQPGWKNYKMQSMLLLTLTTVLIIFFW